MRGWIYHNVIFLFPIIYGGCDYIVTLCFHLWQYLVRGWIYRDIIFSLLTIFGAGVIISWHYIFTADNIWLGVIILWHNIHTPDNIWSGSDYIVTSYFHFWQYFVRGDYIVTWYSHPRQNLVRGWLYRDIIFSLLAIFGQGVIISWHYIFTPDNIWCGGDYIVTLYLHCWQYLVRGVIILWHNILTSDNIWS